MLIIPLDTIAVIANEQYTDGTASAIRREAIEHIQAHSLADVLQLLLGNTLQDNSLSLPPSPTVIPPPIPAWIYVRFRPNKSSRSR